MHINQIFSQTVQIKYLPYVGMVSLEIGSVFD